MQNEISWNENTRYEIYNPYIDIPILEPCDTPKIGKYRPMEVVYMINQKVSGL